MYTLVLSVKFQRELAKLAKGNSTLKKQFKKIVKLLQTDLKHPSLRLHKLSGIDFWSISINESIRIIIRISADKLYLLEIGKHEDVY